MTGGLPGRYKIVYSGAVRQSIQNLCGRASAVGKGPAVLAALAEMENRLHADPLTFGEEKHRYHNLNLEVRAAIQPPLVIHYAVHLSLPVVFVRQVKPLSGHGF